MFTKIATKNDDVFWNISIYIFNILYALFFKIVWKILYNLWEYLDKLLKYHKTEYQSILKNI